MRRDLAAVLEEFVATHRGLRLGRLFGAPAAFAGRRVFAKLDKKDLKLRSSSMNLTSLTSDRRERAHRVPKARGLSSRWITISPGSPAAARLEMLLEQSVRDVSLA